MQLYSVGGVSSILNRQVFLKDKSNLAKEEDLLTRVIFCWTKPFFLRSHSDCAVFVRLLSSL